MDVREARASLEDGDPLLGAGHHDHISSAAKLDGIEGWNRHDFGRDRGNRSCEGISEQRDE
jgi:hypothetical protein